jgi:membrane peptidoglycan carboxypeptidase
MEKISFKFGGIDLKKVFIILLLVFFIVSLTTPLIIYKKYTASLTPPQSKIPASLVVEYADGTPLYTPKTTWVDFDDIPTIIKDSIVASEDKRFYQHSGVDPIGIARALFTILTTDELQGGSTITQQLARTLYLNNERTWKRKIKEALIALWLEQNFSKNEILEMYINSVYLGNGVYGFPAAAKYYFNKSLEQLTPIEIAMLTATLRSPEKANPQEDLNKDFSKNVLRKMKEAGIINEGEYENAVNNLETKHTQIKNILKNDFDEDLFWIVVTELKELGFELGDLRNGFRVRTTIDKGLQSLLNSSISKDSWAGLIVEYTTGKIRAAYGLGIINGRRQIGSTIKPFYYYLAFMAGYNSDDVLEDKPIKIGSWTPENFDKTFRGQVTLEDALAHSLNIPSINLFMKLGQGKVTNFLKNTLMISGFYPNDATLALGTLETSLIDVAQGYTAIFTGGSVIRPRIVEYVKDKNGQLYYSYTPNLINVVKAPKDLDKRTPLEASILMLRAMEKVVTSGTSRSAQMPGRKIYGKSGSAENNAWFVGGDGKYIFILARDNVKQVSGLVVTPLWKEIALKTEIGYTPISLPINISVSRFRNDAKEPSSGSDLTIAETKTENPTNPESTTQAEEVANPQSSGTSSQESYSAGNKITELLNRIRKEQISVKEIVEIVQSLPESDRKTVLSEINSISPEIASEVYRQINEGTKNDF